MKEKKRCVYFPFCWRKVAGYIERKFVRIHRDYVCEYHAKKHIKKHEKEKWSGEDWYEQEYIELNNHVRNK